MIPSKACLGFAIAFTFVVVVVVVVVVAISMGLICPRVIYA